MSDLIVMFTRNDSTVLNATKLFKKYFNPDIKFWGIKASPLSTLKMKLFFNAVHSKNKTGVLESVTYTESEGLNDAKKAYKCNADILMGTKYSKKIHEFCLKHKIQYFPFTGTPEQIPSILNNTSEEIINDSNFLLQNKVDGIDYLAYRKSSDSITAISDVLQNLPPEKFCIAGSVNSFEKLNQIKKLKAAFFTVGSAFFENKFGNSFEEQIKNIYNYMKDTK